MNCVTFLLSSTWRYLTTSVGVKDSCHTPCYGAGEIWFRRLMWLGHTACMSNNRLPTQALFEQLPGPGIKGRPKDNCAKGLDCFETAEPTGTSSRKTGMIPVLDQGLSLIQYFNPIRNMVLIL